MQRELFERFAGKMMTICRRYTRDRMEAEDMLQVGFMKAFDRIDQHRGGSLEAWLKKIFINTCLNQWRKSKSEFWVKDENQMDGILMEDDGLHQLQAAELLSLIDSLPSGAKIIFNLFALEGFPHTEIAIMLNITESASRAQLSRARKLLQQQLRNHF